MVRAVVLLLQVVPWVWLHVNLVPGSYFRDTGKPPLNRASNHLYHTNTIPTTLPVLHLDSLPLVGIVPPRKTMHDWEVWRLIAHQEKVERRDTPLRLCAIKVAVPLL